jgi:hypothetical protein
VTKYRHFLNIATAVFLVAVPVTGCIVKEQPGGEDLQAFSSMDEAYTAVNDVLACEADPVGDPIVPMGDGIRLASAQKLCFEKVQIDLFADEKAFRETYQILSDSNQGKIHLVHGVNWMVVDFTEMATGQPSTRDIERLAEKLNGEYVTVGL